MSLVATARRLRHGPLRALGPLWVALGRLYRGALRLLPRRPSVSQKIGPYGPFRLDGEFTFSDFENWGGGHNKGFQACVEACRGQHCLFDVGAHIGLVTLPASRLLAPGGKVVAFEPANGNLHYLHRHLALNAITNVEIVPALVGAEPRDRVTFYEQEGATGENTVAPRGRAGFAPTARRQVTLDSFCAERGLSPDVLKIDVEGAEIDVLAGARRTLALHRPTVFLSVHPRHIAAMGRELAELTDLIAELDYRCLTMEGAPAGTLTFDEYRLEPKETDARHDAA